MTNPDDAPRLVVPASSPTSGARIGDSQPTEPPSTGSFHAPAGPYNDLVPHARGGIGEVFSATDPVLNRTVAVKKLQDRRADDVESRRRFLVEAEVTARLEHPGVVPVYSLFADECGRPAYAMRFVQGPTLWDRLREYHAGPPDAIPFRRLLQSFLQVCQTVAYAHSRGVIHRDLKPQNILLGKFGETLVVDWGLAKVVGRSEEARTEPAVEGTLVPSSGGTGDETAMGSAVGTPAYMSPEQAAGRWNVIDHRSDVYGLGAVLYAVLTGKPPLEKSDWPEMQQKIQRGDFPRPRGIKPDLPRALDAVCLKAMAVDPGARYSSAEALAADVEHWLADEPVSAHREPLAARARRWIRTHRTLATATAVLLVAAVVGLSIGAVLLQRARLETDNQRKAAETAKKKAEAINRFLIDDLLKQADPANNSVGETITVRQLLDKAAARIDSQTDLSALPEVEVEVRTVLARAFENLGASEQAGRHYLRVWELRSRLLGPNHLDTLRARNDYVYIVVDADLNPQALTLAREANEACEHALGASHPETARALGTLGAALMSQEDTVGAERATRQSRDLLHAALGPDDRLTLDADNSLSAVLGKSGRPAEAEAILRSIVARRRKTPRDPDLALAIGNLGYTLLIQGKFADAEVLANEAVDVGGRTVGPTNPGTLQARNLLGYTREGLHRWADAEREYREVLEIRRQIKPPTAFDIQLSLGFLARLHAKQQQWAKAGPYLAELLLAQKPDPNRKRDVLASDLVAALTGQTEPGPAEPLLRECAEALKATLWQGDWLRAEVRSLYGACLRRQAKFKEAERHLLPAATDTAQAVGAPAWGVAAARKRVYDLYDAWNRPNEAAQWK